MAQRKQVDPKEQFSKKLAGRAEWFWFGFMGVLVIAIIVSPGSADAAVYLGVMVTAVMLISVVAYTKNSTMEKALYAATQIQKLQLTWKDGKPPDADAEDDTEETEGESHG